MKWSLSPIWTGPPAMVHGRQLRELAPEAPIRSSRIRLYQCRLNGYTPLNDHMSVGQPNASKCLASQEYIAEHTQQGTNTRSGDGPESQNDFSPYFMVFEAVISCSFNFILFFLLRIPWVSFLRETPYASRTRNHVCYKKYSELFDFSIIFWFFYSRWMCMKPCSKNLCPL